ncbi:MAG: hypothetical protein QF890_09740 [Myxococcota bacterium]|nr:hypothetical protein [bacterium]MDP6075456.1 hypothetical protein [Myxococcota bacterium]MDP6242873.1 hypothetical protein [Myxococcota bacterium]MDP7075670.1 hypothetical protein [Myxococcota bacterium]MDP7297898.1 hypothetical protein [Myxococcota bacterium]
MSNTVRMLMGLACIALGSVACTTTYTEADLTDLDEEAAVHEKDDIARQKELVQKGGLNNELLEDQLRWADTEANR